MKILEKLKWKYNKAVYVLFYNAWNPILANSPELCLEFLTTFKVYRFQDPVEVSEIAQIYAMRWNRTSQAKTVENLVILIEEAIYEARNRSEDSKSS